METVILKRRPFRTPDNRTIRRWVDATIHWLDGTWTELGILLCGPITMRRYQRCFRGRDYVTDVLSFPGDESHLGDIVICVDRVRSQGAEAGISFETELKSVLVHGILHCAGYDHEQDRGEMSAIQLDILRSLS